MIFDRGHLTIEVAIENVDHRLGRQPVRQRGKAAQIRKPDRRLHRLGMAAADLPTKNPLADAIPT